MANFEMPVSLYMTAPVAGVAPDTGLNVAHARLTDLGVSALAVVDRDHKLVGVVTRTDLLRLGRKQAGRRHGASALTLPSKPVGDVMTKSVLTVRSDDPVSKAAKLMVDEHVHRVFVVDNESPVGVLSTRNIMAAIRDKRMRHPLSDFMSTPVFTVRTTETLSLAVERLEKARVSGLVVVDDDWPVGVFTQEEALGAKDFPGDTQVEEIMSPAMLCLDVSTPMHRAAAHASAMDVRRIIAVENKQMSGILTGLDLARCAV